MNQLNVKINYLYHSGFAIETQDYLLIFDYYKHDIETRKNISEGVISEGDLNTHKTVIVFSSHSHHDHFNPIILDWLSIRDDIHYVLSDDIQLDHPIKNTHFLSKYETLNLNNLFVKAYGSTDLGISFFIQVDGVHIFHAGDLNWWYWWRDTKSNIESAAQWFKDEVAKIDESIDIAFFPVDQRLEHNYSLGGQYFIEKIQPTYFIPMHFGDHYDTTDRFYNEVKASSTRIFKIHQRGQKIQL
ncbi:L-ascorbate metabolism protein UlaG (beta-lactamase superfamily) [Natranaerovirga hydrolytica]|uniref:L-ascorbate metabolism protein UlaG (Beta-lactamase superfamily) n=2 Tax=Natranaerovirga hydrolytica TaxID=680378 RepID=A0A4R1MNL3_9FIRM|nr:MBL fold metallo-hydrolase [Natranaerovirga hydrolytica]TCK92894.1 L-ascorbate metabolism protein UlaG (beta-lactamase superfamily) [Natranaerovirga hydrolytica]